LAPLPDWAAPMNDIPGVAGNLTRVLKAAGVTDTADRVSAIGQEIFDLCDGSFPFALARLAKLLADAAEPPITASDLEVEDALDPEGPKYDVTITTDEQEKDA